MSQQKEEAFCSATEYGTYPRDTEVLGYPTDFKSLKSSCDAFLTLRVRLPELKDFSGLVNHTMERIIRIVNGWLHLAKLLASASENNKHLFSKEATEMKEKLTLETKQQCFINVEAEMKKLFDHKTLTEEKEEIQVLCITHVFCFLWGCIPPSEVWEFFSRIDCDQSVLQKGIKSVTSCNDEHVRAAINFLKYEGFHVRDCAERNRVKQISDRSQKAVAELRDPLMHCVDQSINEFHLSQNIKDSSSVISRLCGSMIFELSNSYVPEEQISSALYIFTQYIYSYQLQSWLFLQTNEYCLPYAKMLYEDNDNRIVPKDELAHFIELLELLFRETNVDYSIRDFCKHWPQSAITGIKEDKYRIIDEKIRNYCKDRIQENAHYNFSKDVFYSTSNSLKSILKSNNLDGIDSSALCLQSLLQGKHSKESFPYLTANNFLYLLQFSQEHIQSLSDMLLLLLLIFKYKRLTQTKPIFAFKPYLQIFKDSHFTNLSLVQKEKMDKLVRLFSEPITDYQIETLRTQIDSAKNEDNWKWMGNFDEIALKETPPKENENTSNLLSSPNDGLWDFLLENEIFESQSQIGKRAYNQSSDDPEQQKRPKMSELGQTLTDSSIHDKPEISSTEMMKFSSETQDFREGMKNVTKSTKKKCFPYSSRGPLTLNFQFISVYVTFPKVVEIKDFEIVVSEDRKEAQYHGKASANITLVSPDNSADITIEGFMENVFVPILQLFEDRKQKNPLSPLEKEKLKELKANFMNQCSAKGKSNGLKFFKAIIDALEEENEEENMI